VLTPTRDIPNNIYVRPWHTLMMHVSYWSQLKWTSKRKWTSKCLTVTSLYLCCERGDCGGKNYEPTGDILNNIPNGCPNFLHTQKVNSHQNQNKNAKTKNKIYIYYKTGYGKCLVLLTPTVWWQEGLQKSHSTNQKVLLWNRWRIQGADPALPHPVFLASMLKMILSEFCQAMCREKTRTRMWANAQPDGRPAEHRWRLLFNAPKFG